MKLRVGFVSNSSSSSYIIALDEPKKCKECGRSDADILDLISKSTQDYGVSDDNEVNAIGLDNIKKYMKESWCLDDKEMDKIIGKLNKEKNKKLALIQISYHDETLSNLLDSNKNIKILWRSE